jgi:hypothetical protein
MLLTAATPVGNFRFLSDNLSALSIEVGDSHHKLAIGVGATELSDVTGGLKSNYDLTDVQNLKALIDLVPGTAEVCMKESKQLELKAKH